MKEDGWNNNTDPLAAVLKAKAEIENDTGLRPPNPMLFPKSLWDRLGGGSLNPRDAAYIMVIDTGQGRWDKKRGRKNDQRNDSKRER